jgi:NAD(P) transhydrogenase subunit alpha
MKISTIVDKQDERVAIIPEVVGKYVELGFEVVLPKNVGVSSGFEDKEYAAAGAKMSKKDYVDEADIYVAVRPTLTKTFSKTYFSSNLKASIATHFVALLSPYRNSEVIGSMLAEGINLYALDLIPRITRAQSMDVLSSQASISGYRAVLEALAHYNRVVPLMMTAAGTIRPAKFLILGAGVAGLQAIATAKRLGAVVAAFDVRTAAKEQVESLGARFVAVDDQNSGEGAGGYAKEMDDDYKKRQAEKLSQELADADIVISTAQIPGKPAPLLITKSMVQTMHPGSVICDMAVESGGNCELSKPNAVEKVGGVTIIDISNMAAKVSHDASRLFARNVLNFVSLMIKDGGVDTSDEIIKSTKLTSAEKT